MTLLKESEPLLILEFVLVRDYEAKGPSGERDGEEEELTTS